MKYHCGMHGTFESESKQHGRVRCPICSEAKAAGEPFYLHPPVPNVCAHCGKEMDDLPRRYVQGRSARGGDTARWHRVAGNVCSDPGCLATEWEIREPMLWGRMADIALTSGTPIPSQQREFRLRHERTVFTRFCIRIRMRVAGSGEGPWIDLADEVTELD